MSYVALAARVCLSIIFLKSGIGKIMGFDGLQQTLTSQNLPLVPVLAVGTIAFLVAGGVSILLGFKTRIGAVLLVIFLIPTTLIFHNPIVNSEEWNSFLKNLGLVGGLLMLIYAGAGALSLDTAMGAIGPGSVGASNAADESEAT